jgi:hypothetical protein
MSTASGTRQKSNDRRARCGRPTRSFVLAAAIGLIAVGAACGSEAERGAGDADASSSRTKAPRAESIGPSTEIDRVDPPSVTPAQTEPTDPTPSEVVTTPPPLDVSFDIEVVALIRSVPGGSQCALRVTVMNDGPDDADGISVAAAVEGLVSPTWRVDMNLEGPSIVGNGTKAVFSGLVAYAIPPDYPIGWAVEIRHNADVLATAHSEIPTYCS